MSDRKRVGALASVAVVALAVPVLLAFATIDPPPLPMKHRKTHTGVATAASVAPPAAAPAATVPPPPVSSPVSAPVSTTVSTPAAAPATSAPATPPKAAAVLSPPSQAADVATVGIDELRTRAGQNEVAAMEELGRRLLQGINVPKDPQAGAGWLLRAAALGSAQSAFNVGVMYERGFIVERDSSKAAEWYRKAADAGLPTAKHNLALLLRDGKGVARDVKAAVQLLLSAAHQGMAASMFTLGDIYEQGDSGTRDLPAALAWFAVTGEYERQINRDGESALAKTAGQHAQVLKRTLTTAELERAQELAQGEFRRIVAQAGPPGTPSASSLPLSEPASPVPALPPPTPSESVAAKPAAIVDPTTDWPKSTADQIRAIQQALLDLKRLRDKPDGNLGPMTRAAIRDFQKSTGMRPTGEPSRELYAALVLARHDVVSGSPLPMPPPVAIPDPPKIEPAKPAAAATPPQRTDDSKIDLGRAAPPPPPPTSAEVAAITRPAAAPRQPDPPKPPPVVVETAKPAPFKVETTRPTLSPAYIPPPSAPPPPTSADIARAGPPKIEPPTPEPPKVEIAKADPNAWPASRPDQVKAIQTLLRDLRFYTKAIDGQVSGGTQAAIREYQRMAGLKETGEANKALFDSLTEMRKLMAPAKN
jgi:peptidoglycan hydrolase-like protein with peptidoglycan-binding domain